LIAGLLSPSTKMGPSGTTGTGLIQSPIPESCRDFQGNSRPILLARGCDVGVRDHPVGRNPVTREDAAAERGHCGDLATWKFRVAVVVSGIGDLDADRARVEIGLARPRRFAGVPGAATRTL